MSGVIQCFQLKIMYDYLPYFILDLLTYSRLHHNKLFAMNLKKKRSKQSLVNDTLVLIKESLSCMRKKGEEITWSDSKIDSF